jgi:AAA domain
MDFVIQEAKRELIWVKLALIAPSGGGKTYSSLRLATGMLAELKEKGLAQNGKILMGNTEGSRGRYYANEFKYDITDIAAPHHPERYVKFINYAAEQGYPILILDSSSHEWEGNGGCLELHQKYGGTYQAWGKVTPLHEAFVYALADSPVHIIATMRGKDQYEMEVGEQGKKTVRKLGVGAQQRNNFEYEFTSTFLIDQRTNLADAQKDNTHLFEDRSSFKLNEEDGQKVIRWANSGEGYTIPVRVLKSPTEILDETSAKVVALCKSLGGKKNDQLMEVLREYDSSGNPNRIKDLDKLNELVDRLEKMEKGE